MQNDKANDDRTPKTAPHGMPAFGDIMKNTDAPKQEFVSQMVEKISRQDNEDFSTEVPTFNLGQNILAQQRKIAAFKRKSPLSPNVSEETRQPESKIPVPIQSIPQPPASPQQKIIAEIVAREIEALTAAKR
ncbi:MAG: hypothetical protein CVV39_05550 [Planctomycetes bacterium HGW-Planctomycetes-1]|nr:MAG: hypothetical protein CVV39_05550 [Planctomycetes bacterium HGW-Planctomycetes-1]